MKAHYQAVAAFNIAAGALFILIALAVFIFMGMATGIVVSQGDHQAAGVIGIVAVALSCFLGLLGLPSIIGGVGLLKEKSWAKPLLLVLAVLHLPNVPFGTALGVYTLWALLQNEPQPQIPAPVAHPVR